MQRAKHLARQLGGDGGLGIAAGFQESVQALIGWGIEQAKAAEQAAPATETAEEPAATETPEPVGAETREQS